jgi:probable H4MPT-linked C1 transfer pathway protein
MPPAVLGLDIGGANLKAAHTGGAARTVPFAVWKAPDRLAEQLAALVAAMPPADVLAVTMTAELCDCYESKRAGVNAILDAVAAARPAARVRVWQNDGGFVDLAEGRRSWLKTAAANWLALATLAARLCPAGPALVVDLGSTTTDLVPARDGVPVPEGRTDPERLQTGELIYMGVTRTPLCALLGTWRRTAAEFFATTRDVYLVLGDLPEAPDDRDTADGRPATRPFAQARLARMVCADAETLGWAAVHNLAMKVRRLQIDMLREEVDSLLDHRFPDDAARGQLVIAGAGEFLLREAFAEPAADVPLWWTPRPIVSLAGRLGPAVSAAAAAHAVAVLAAERG